jgi:hypothetical protein
VVRFVTDTVLRGADNRGAAARGVIVGASVAVVRLPTRAVGPVVAPRWRGCSERVGAGAPDAPRGFVVTVGERIVSVGR